MSNKFISLNDHVCEYISEKISSGEMHPGEKINENQLCEKLDISRTPIREALIELSSKQIIEKIPRKGFYIKKINVEKSKEIYEIIGLLESHIACNVMDKISDDDIRKMNQIYEQMCVSLKYKDLFAYKNLQMKFHNIYIQLYDNNTLINTLNEFKFSISLQTFYDKNNDDLYSVLNGYNNGHKLIIKYLKEKDKIKLSKLLREEHWVLKSINVIN